MFGGWGLGWCSVPHLLSGLRLVVSPPSLSSLLPGTVTLGTGQMWPEKSTGSGSHSVNGGHDDPY